MAIIIVEENEIISQIKHEIQTIKEYLNHSKSMSVGGKMLIDSKLRRIEEKLERLKK